MLDVTITVCNLLPCEKLFRCYWLKLRIITLLVCVWSKWTKINEEKSGYQGLI